MALNQLKKKLFTKPMFFNYQKERITDASTESYGSVLLKRNNVDGQFHLVHVMSRKTTDVEKKDNYELEVLAVV